MVLTSLPYLETGLDELWPYIPVVSIPVQSSIGDETEDCEGRRGELFLRQQGEST